jgi:DNA helicase-2/ATP-dependent DNA helicase PcrA
MTRAMNTLILTRAHYRRRYGNDAPEMSVPSRFIEEVPSQLIENLGSRVPSWATPGYPNTYGSGSRFGAGRRPAAASDFGDKHFNYEDESQETPSASSANGRGAGSSVRSASSKPFVASWMTPKAKPASASAAAGSPLSTHQPSPKQGSAEAPEAHSIDNIARFFGGKAIAGKPGMGKPGSLPRPAMDIPESTGAANLKKGQRVRHSKYGEGTVLMREGEGEDAKLTVLFSRHGMKKLMEKFANLKKI